MLLIGLVLYLVGEEKAGSILMIIGAALGLLSFGVGILGAIVG